MWEYRDFVTGKMKKTRGNFVGWTPKQGPLNARYAIFKNKRSEILVPEYCLSDEVKKDIELLQDMRRIFNLKNYTKIIKLKAAREEVA